MTRFTTSRADPWVEPRQPLHASERHYRHGPVQPLKKPGLLSRLLGAR